MFFSYERFACYDSYQCPASEHKLEGVRFLSVGGFIIATGGAVGNRVDKFVAARRVRDSSATDSAPGTEEEFSLLRSVSL